MHQDALSANAVRAFRNTDAESLCALWARVFPGDPPWNAPERMLETKLSVQPELLLVHERGGQIVGAVIAGFDGVRGWLYHLAVAPEYRRQGIASSLVRAAEQRLLELGCPKVNLQVRADNTSVVALYRALGYEVEERVSMGRRLGAR
jgi:ribosomal protein S18 acetylase RimI-like enzyme